ncbi:PPE family protein [Candidatus Mycobacterium wuenschmannii]|uniref:PPE family protein n=1 Tax=Candidatus Mycobacterium wuenschmannii TaxID=3027808 RepID=A0ABY8W617_9MYCO|nr:PPE family protein [Candidatus Mycobacterium wuenschmannii]WIM89873.1 PPE family protein [Candidatus Mycobacterium wuenschmannii]
MSFSLIPPEINSALMYSGAGSGPLLEAATAWDELAADLEATATQYQTAVTNLTTGPWLGPSSAHMASAAEPYIAWMQGTAATAAQTGAQAKAAAAAYQTAYTSMVPPPVIEANRAMLTTLVSNNFLGQNTGAIAQNEAEYLEMWIQDALGMDTYSQASTASSTLPEHVAAPLVTSGSDATAAAAAAAPADVASNGLESIIVGAIQGIGNLFGGTSVAPLTSLTGLSTYLPALGTALAANPSAALLPVQATYYMGMLGSTPARMFMSGGGSGSGAGISSDTLVGMKDSLLDNVGKLIDSKAGTVMEGVSGQLGKWGAGIQAGIQAQMSNAMHAGGLSVPHSWHTGAGAGMDRAAPLLPGNSVASPSMSTGLPSSPFSQGLMGALAGRGMSAMGSRVAAKVMPRSPAGG